MMQRSSVGLFLLVLAAPVMAQTSHPEVLVVYNSNSADSLMVANHYLARRNIPASNLCPIAPPSDTALSLGDYNTYVKTPVRNCLNAAGSKKILYIVMSYDTPFEIYGVGPGSYAAIDSYLADVWDKYATPPFLIAPPANQPYYADSQSQGNVYVPFQPFAKYRAGKNATLIYVVWRLDAPSAALASALVDQAIQSETSGGPVGQACIDREYGSMNGMADFGYQSGDWDLHQAATFLEQAGVTVLEDANSAEFGTAPAPLTCPMTAFYSGWYSYNHYNDAFTWQPGSIGWHLDSASALSPRGGPSWSPNALARGIAVTSGSVDEPNLQGLTRPGGTYRNLLEGASVGDAFLRNTRWLKWEIMFMGDPLYRPFGAGRAPFSPLQPVNSFAASPQELVGGKAATGTITLNSPAPTGGLVFTLSSAGSITVPASVKVPARSTSATFTITTQTVTQSVPAEITATTATIALSNTMTLDPLLGALAASTYTASAGLPVTATVFLNDKAPKGGIAISLSSSSAAASVPASVTVPSGATTANFTISTVPVTGGVVATITGTYAGASTSLALGLVPAISNFSIYPSSVAAGQTVEIDISLASPAPAGGATVQLTSSNPAALPAPSTMVVAAGGTFGHIQVTTGAGSSGTVPTLTAQYGGATATATVTIN